MATQLKLSWARAGRAAGRPWRRAWCRRTSRLLALPSPRVRARGGAAGRRGRPAGVACHVPCCTAAASSPNHRSARLVAVVAWRCQVKPELNSVRAGEGSGTSTHGAWPVVSYIARRAAGRAEPNANGSAFQASTFMTSENARWHFNSSSYSIYLHI